MQVPLEVTYQGVDRSDWSENFVREQVDRLNRYAGEMIACRVAIEKPHQHRNKGNPYHVRVEVTLPPRKDLVAVSEPKTVPASSELRNVIRDAFRAMEKQLKKTRQQRRYDVKVHDAPSAFVVRLFEGEDYGFLKTTSGEEIYFHRNSVLHGDFDRLGIGTRVRFEVEEGEKGLQASTVQILDKPGQRTRPDGAPDDGAPMGWEKH
jgi:cold shock CspA family protein/ribosome-associated translation inhibitor RaiA